MVRSLKLKLRLFALMPINIVDNTYIGKLTDKITLF